MKRLSIVLGAALAAGCSPSKQDPNRPGTPPDATTLELPGVGLVTLSGPHTRGNLAVYVIHKTSGVDPDQEYQTLEEGMTSGAVVLTEKQGVGTLEIENSSDRAVFIQAGDVVKGGKQDRTLYHTFVLPPHSGKVNVQAFCVEHGRWSGQAKFDSSGGQLYTKEAKLAARDAQSQQKVWDEVAVAKRQLAGKAGAGPSQTDSINEEYVKAKGKIEEFERALADEISRSPDAVGLAYGINGGIDGLQVYESHRLFVKMHRKVLRACAAEAIAKDQGRGQPAADAKKCAGTIQDGLKRAAAEKKTEMPAENGERAKSSDANACFEHLYKGKVVHLESVIK